MDGSLPPPPPGFALDPTSTAPAPPAGFTLDSTQPGALTELATGAVKGITGIADIGSALFDPGGMASQASTASALAADPRLIAAAKAHGMSPQAAAQDALRSHTSLQYWLDKAVGGVTGGNPEAIPANTPQQRLLQNIGAGLSTAVLPMGEGMTVANMLRNGLIGAGAGATSSVAQEAAPEPLKPIVGVVGALAGGVATHGALEGLGAAARGAGGAAQRATDPILAGVSSAAAERAATRDVAAGITGNVRTVADQLRAASETVAGEKPTSYQVTADTGLGGQERNQAVRQPQPFIDRAAEQNTAQIAALANLQSGGDQLGLTSQLRAGLDALDHETSADVARAAFNAADLATQAKTETEMRVGAANTKAQGLATELAGSAPDVLGQTVQGAVEDAMKAARAKSSALYDAAFPTADITANTLRSSTAARDILANEPGTAEMPSGREAALFETAQSIPPIAPARDLVELSQRAKDIQREELRINGQSKVYRRVSQLTAAIQDNLANTMADQLAHEDVEGTAPVDGLRGRLQDWVDGYLRDRGRSGDEGLLGARAVSAGAATADAGAYGSALSANERFGSLAGDQGIPSSAERAAALADVRAYRDPLGKSLFATIRELGGLKLQDEGGTSLPGPDVADMMRGLRLQAGVINNRTGLSPEYMAQALADRGFFPEKDGDPSAAFEAAVDREARGERVFSASAEGGLRPDRLAVLERELSEIGISGTESVTSAARKLADYRAIRRSLVARADALGIQRAETMTINDLWGDILEREAIQEPAEPAADHGAEFDRLVRGLPQRPTVDAAASQRLRAADANYRENVAGVFKRGPNKDVLAKAGPADVYKLSAGAVPGKYWARGPTGGAAAMALVKAIGADRAVPLLIEAAGESLRKAALRDNGQLDPNAFRVWRNNYSEALKALPSDVRAKFGAAVQASREAAQTVADRAVAEKEAARTAKTMMDDAEASRTERMKAAQEGAVGRLMGATEPGEVSKLIGITLGRATAPTEVKAIVKAAKGDPDAINGLRQAAADHINGKFISATNGEPVKAAQFQEFLKDKREALAEIFTPAQLAGMRRIAESLKRTQMSQSGARLKNASSATAQDSFSGNVLGNQGIRRTMLELLAVGASGAGLHSGWLAFAGALGVAGIETLRAAGLRNIDDVKTRMLLDPQFAAAMLDRIPAEPGNRAAIRFAQAVRASVMAAGLTPGASTGRQ